MRVDRGIDRGRQLSPRCPEVPRLQCFWGETFSPTGGAATVAPADSLSLAVEWDFPRDSVVNYKHVKSVVASLI